MALYLDMDQGTVSPSYVTPEAVARLVGRADARMNGASQPTKRRNKEISNHD